MNHKQLVCDHERIELFLRQQLTRKEQANFEAHLNACDDCCQRLEQAAAAEDVRYSIRDSLRAERVSLESDEGFDGAADSIGGEDRPAFSVENVRQLLAPTDDDRMMGRLGSYEVIGIIGAGGMGVVVKALDPALNRYVAIKILSPHLGNSGAARKRFSREARAAAAVVHDNVVEIHGVADANGLPYLVMPYVRGPSLQRRLDDEGPLSVVEILRISRQAAAGLAAAHAQGLVHRDVKPANILLANGIERVKLTDFGLARAADDASLTKTGVIAGTPQFMSPEQARGELVDQRSDLFSLGSVMYTMCTGRPPFRAETSYGILRRITDTQPRPISEINPDVPDWLCEIIAKLMSKAPDDRFASAAEVAELLEGSLAHVQQPTALPLPPAVTQLPKLRTTDEKTHQRQRPTGSLLRRPPAVTRLIGLAAMAFLFIVAGVAGVLIVLETNKGTLTIESDADNVPIRIMQSDKVVEELTLSKQGASIRLAAGQYVVEIAGESDQLDVVNGSVTLKRGKKQIVRITHMRAEARQMDDGVVIDPHEHDHAAQHNHHHAHDARISVTEITDNKVTVSGTATSDCVLVLSVGKSKLTKQIDYQWVLDGAFSADLTSTDKLSLGDGVFGKGIVFNVYRAHKAKFTCKIPLSGITMRTGSFTKREEDDFVELGAGHVLPDGVIRLRPRTSEDKNIPAVERENDTITFADIICTEGTVVPLTIFVRQGHNPNPASRLNWGGRWLDGADRPADGGRE